MALFKDKHPSCKRSLLSKLGESNHQTSLKEAVVKSKSKVVKVEQLKRNPAVDIMSDIEGFSDWTLGRVRDFISCMDMARRKYTEMKENGPQMKLVPLVLNEDHEDTGEKYCGEPGLRTWIRQMLDELVASRKQAIGKKKSVGGEVNFGNVLGDLLITSPERRTCLGSTSGGVRGGRRWRETAPRHTKLKRAYNQKSCPEQWYTTY